MKNLVLAFLIALGLSPAAFACTVSTVCNNGCQQDIFCPSPYPHCELSCSVPPQTLSCSGTTCSGTPNEVPAE